jgi:hypothetical protein
MIFAAEAFGDDICLQASDLSWMTWLAQRGRPDIILLKPNVLFYESSSL